MRSPACRRRAGLRPDDGSAVPFSSAAEAWFWYLTCHQARLDGARVVAGLASVARPCEPGDIYRAVHRLYQNGQLQAHHVKVLVRYGRSRLTPDPDRPAGHRDCPPWQEAIIRLDGELRARGLVA
jgi:hypothetical protein